jgi:hypothetical protein
MSTIFNGPSDTQNGKHLDFHKYFAFIIYRNGDKRLAKAQEHIKIMEKFEKRPL